MGLERWSYRVRSTPDEFVEFKTTLKQGFEALINRKLGSKEQKMIYCEDGRKLTEIVDTAPEERLVAAISDRDVLQLARWTMLIEEHYSKVHERPTPMDVEWAKDGLTDELFIVQARSETVQSRKEEKILKQYRLLDSGELLPPGKAVGAKIGAVTACVLKNVKDIHKFRAGDVLVTDHKDPDCEPIMKKASAIVTNRGGRTCHAAIISRELGVHCDGWLRDGDRVDCGRARDHHELCGG